MTNTGFEIQRLENKIIKTLEQSTLFAKIELHKGSLNNYDVPAFIKYKIKLNNKPIEKTKQKIKDLTNEVSKILTQNHPEIAQIFNPSNNQDNTKFHKEEIIINTQAKIPDEMKFRYEILHTMHKTIKNYLGKTE